MDGGIVTLPLSRSIIGWRYWSVGADGGTIRLRSPFRATPWPVGAPMEAECLAARLVDRRGREGHVAPAPGCRCGIYGGTYRRLRTFLQGDVGPSSSIVLGRVFLWGPVIASGSSWRAKFGYPERLLVPTLVHDAPHVAEELEAYGVTVTLLDVGQTFGALHPRTRLHGRP